MDYRRGARLTESEAIHFPGEQQRVSRKLVLTVSVIKCKYFDYFFI